MPFHMVRRTGKHVKPVGKHVKPEAINVFNQPARCSVDYGYLGVYYEGPRGPMFLVCEICRRIYSYRTGSEMKPIHFSLQGR